MLSAIWMGYYQAAKLTTYIIVLMFREISLQGIAGSFHDVVRRRLFANSTFWPRLRFPDVFQDLSDKNADYGLIAIENSIAGSLVFNYDLLAEHPYNIVGEAYLRINHCLMALPGQAIDDINEIWSHPMAIYQSQKFLNSQPFRVIEKEDTAGSAKLIKDLNVMGTAAIASAEAAELYGLELLARNIETDPNNYTRFLILSEKNLAIEKVPIGQKCSLYIRFTDKAGDLHNFLAPLQQSGFSMTKIESRPKIGSPWHYDFYIDIDFTAHNNEAQKKLINELEKRCKHLRVLGIYPTFGYI